AQVQLVERLAVRAQIPRDAAVLDVGCGFGGSALWLAQELGCTVLGITLSSVQAEIASERARLAGLAARVRFEIADANHLDARSERFDVVWTVECSEHLFDKAGFCASCARLLRPGGRLAVCAWLARPSSRADEDLIADVCRGMLCPSLGRMEDYFRWMDAAGFEGIQATDITGNVAPTWDRVDAILRRRDVQTILRLSKPATREFARACGSIRRAYALGAMGYGMFAAKIPAENSTRTIGAAR
ncbi:MAG: methyltransferase domain-containing protein, partial [Opitutaceae bacterium]